MAFQGGDEALTTTDCTNTLKRSRYSNKAVSNSNISHKHYYSNTGVTKRQNTLKLNVLWSSA